MANLFDHLQDTVFDTTTRTMGYDATWTPSAGGAIHSARVLLNEPTESEKLGFVNKGYEPPESMMEYRDGVFDGLEASVRNGGAESVTIDGRTFTVQHVIRRYDGKTLVAYLE